VIRVLFFVLLASNVVVFAWSLYRDQSAGESEVEQVSTGTNVVPGLTLISELGESHGKARPAGRVAERSAAAATTVTLADIVEQESMGPDGGVQAEYADSGGDPTAQLPVEPPVEPGTGDELIAEAQDYPTQPVVRCYRLSGFANNKDIPDIRERLAALEIDSRPVVEQQKVQKGFWVFLPAFENDDLARAKIRELRAAEIHDVWLFRKGPLKGAISLGLFAQEHRAKRLQDRVRQKGFEPVVKPRYVDRTVYGVDFSSALDSPVPADVLGEVQREHPGVAILELGCDTIAEP
jgi:hypothetical protein